MKNIQKKAFTLVELLVVITILAIISVVAYQNFGGAVDKAVSGRKIQDVSTIESSLQQYKVDKNYYPPVGEYDATTNVWGYNKTVDINANKSNTINATYPAGSEEISSITGAGGGKIMGINADGTDWSGKQIGAKGTISQNILGKQYLTKDLSDPEINDIKVGTDKKTIDSGIGRYVYGVFKKPLSADGKWASGTNKKGTYYNIAYTVKQDGSDEYTTKIVGDYDSDSCFANKKQCPDSLIGSGTSVLKDKETQTSSTPTIADQGIPYPVTGF